MAELVGGASVLGWAAIAVAAGAIDGRTATPSSTSFATRAVANDTLLVAHRLVSALRRRLRELDVARLEQVEYLLYETHGDVPLVRRGADVGPAVEAGLVVAGYAGSAG